MSDNGLDTLGFTEIETSDPAEVARRAARETPEPSVCDACAAGDHDSCNTVVCRRCDHGGRRLRRHGVFAGSWGIQGGTIARGRKGHR
jgi:hypothetical protein